MARKMRSDSYTFVAVVALLKPTIVGYLQMKIRSGPQAKKAPQPSAFDLAPRLDAIIQHGSFSL